MCMCLVLNAALTLCHACAKKGKVSSSAAICIYIYIYIYILCCEYI